MAHFIVIYWICISNDKTQNEIEKTNKMSKWAFNDCSIVKIKIMQCYQTWIIHLLFITTSQLCLPVSKPIQGRNCKKMQSCIVLTMQNS